MYIRLNKDELQLLKEKVGKVQGITGQSSPLPSTNHILFTANGNSEMTIVATDLNTVVREKIKVGEIIEGGKTCIPSKKFYEIIRELSGNVEFELNSEKKLKISTGKSNFRISCLDTEEFPSWPNIKDDQLKATVRLNSEKLLEMIEKTLYASGSGDYNYELKTLLFHVKPENSFKIVGTDSHRLALIETDEATIKNTEDEVKIIVPRKSCSELKKYLKDYNDEVTISITDNYILFTIGNVVFYARTVEGRYPTNYEAVIPQNDKKVSIERIPFLKALKRVFVISKGNTNVVKLEFNRERLLLSTVENSIGEAKDSIKIEDYTAEDAFMVHFNGSYIIDFLNAVTDEKVTIEFNEPLRPVLMKGNSSDKYQYIVMPVKI